MVNVIQKKAEAEKENPEKENPEKKTSEEKTSEKETSKEEATKAPDEDKVLYKLAAPFFYKGVLHGTGDKVYLPKGTAPRKAVEVTS